MFISENKNIEQLIAQKDIIQSNSMVEAVNKHIKYYYLFKKNLKDIDEIDNYLPDSISDYNDKPHGKSYRLTPNNVLKGNVPDKHKFKNDIAHARKSRLLQNQLTVCCQSE
jgi:putative transposase